MSLFDTAARRLNPAFGRYCHLDTPDARVRLAAMTTMVSTLAYEISQPLSAATNYIHACAAHLRQGGQPSDDVLGLCEEAARQTLRAGEVVRHMRCFVMSGKISGNRENIRTMVERVAAGLMLPDGVDIEIGTVFGADAEYVVADRIHIEQVLSILLVNACKWLVGADGGRIAIAAARTGDQVELRFEGSGPGLTDQALERLFDTGSGAETGKTALGMPVCRMIAEAHGGRLRARTRAEGGTVFTLSLPASE